jgi:hypothetical protein
MTRKLFMKQAITPRLLLVDGLSRTGKMLTAKLASHLRRVEYFQISGPVDHIHILWHLGHLDDGAASSYLRLELDMKIYDRVVGRDLNLRYQDASSLHRAPDFPMYLRRAIEPDVDITDRIKVMERFKQEGRYPFFFTHEALPNIELFFSTAKLLKVIEVVRHPADLAFSWERRGWGNRWGEDPLAVIPAVDFNGKPLPWFAAEWAEEYLAMTPTDRVIQSILVLTGMCRDSIARLSARKKSCIHFIAYENLLTSTETEIGRLASFLETEPFETIPELMTRERLPAQPNTAAVREKLAALRESASPELYDRLVDAGRAYEEQWRLDPVAG